MRRVSILVCAALLSAAAAQSPAAPPIPHHGGRTVTYCAVEMFPDYVYGIGYKALLFLAPGCSVESVGRVRKVSRINPQLTTPGGRAEYGGLWGWNLDLYTSLVPRSALWTGLTSDWQYWTGERWQRVIRR